MPQTTETTVSLDDFLDLEQIEDNIFRGPSHDVGTGIVFGGQVMGQALRAAGRTVKENRPAHSLHGYFILAGDMKAPIVYEVDRIRNGGSFSTRRIVAIQHGRAIFNMSASFHQKEEGLDHQAERPDVPAPNELPSETELLTKLADRTNGEAARRLRARAEQPWPFELRPVAPVNIFRPEKREPVQHLWMRVRHLPLEEAEDATGAAVLRQAVLACISDYSLLSTALMPHGVWFGNGISQAASLDHAMWFHRPFDPGAWFLYAMDSPSASGARGLARGQLYAEDGTLVASVAQEGLMRTPTGS